MFLQKSAVPCVSRVPWTKQHSCFQTAKGEGKRKSSRVIEEVRRPHSQFSNTGQVLYWCLMKTYPFFFLNLAAYWLKTSAIFGNIPKTDLGSCQPLPSLRASYFLLLLILEEWPRNLEETFCWPKSSKVPLFISVILLYVSYFYPSFPTD